MSLANTIPTKSTSDDRFSSPVRIRRVVLERQEGELVLLLKVVFEANLSEVEWRFSGVSQLRFRGETTDLLGIVRLQCEDIASQGWEGKRFRVKDYEEEFISFFCGDFGEVPQS